MNTQDDALATMELKELSTLLPQVPYDPESQVMIYVDGITITRHLETTQRTKAIFSPSLHATRTISSGTSADCMSCGLGRLWRGLSKNAVLTQLSKDVLLLQPPYL
jgi:hypothetical protein